MKSILKTLLVLSLANLLTLGLCRADGNVPSDSGDLLDLKNPTVVDTIKPAQKAVISLWQEGEDRGLKIAYATPNQYPGAAFFCPAGGWNLTGYSGVEASITNAGSSQVSISLRVDNNGDWSKQPPPFDAEFIEIGPGETRTLRVTFGASYGHPGYALDSSQITGLRIFAGMPAASGTVIVHSLKAVR